MRVVALNDDEELIAYAKPILAELRGNMVRADADFTATPFNSDKSRAGAKISNAERLRVHTMLVIGGRDPATRDRRGERASPPRRPQGSKPKVEVIAKILANIKERNG